MDALPLNLTPAEFAAKTGTAVTPTLSADQLAAQNATRGISQTNPPISASGLTTAPPPVDIPPPPTPPTYSTAGIINSINTPSAAETTAKGATDAATQRLNELYTTEGTKGAEQTRLETAQGLPDLNKSLNEINQQIRSLNDSAFSAKQTSEDRQAPSFLITGEQAGIDRQLAVRTYGLSAASSALQGNIALAHDYVTKALAAEFDPIDQQIQYYTNVALPAARAQMTDAQKAKADSIQVMLNDQAAQQTQARADKTAVYATMTSAAQYANSFTPTTQYPTLNSALNAMQTAPNAGAAATIAATTGLTAPKTQTASIQEYEYAKAHGYTGSYSQYQDEDANRKRIAAGGGGTFSPTQLNSGAANSGLGIDGFAALSPDAKNYFVNSYAAFSKMLSDVQKGVETQGQVYQTIKTSNLSDEIKTVLYKQLGVDASGKSLTAGAGNAGGGFHPLKAIGNFFSNIFPGL